MISGLSTIPKLTRIVSSFNIDDFSGGKDLNGNSIAPSSGASRRFSLEDVSFILSFSSSKSAPKEFSLEDVSSIFLF